MKAKAVLLEAPGKMVLTEREIKVREDEVLVKTEYASICGTDKNLYLGSITEDHFDLEMHGKANPFYHREKITFPLWLGHEGGGTVVEVGSRVREFKPGDKVISFSWCGTYAEYFVAPVWGLEKVPEGLEDMKIASLGEPLGCAMFCAMTSGINLGDTAVVLGTGFAGLVIIQALKKRGAYKVIAVDNSPFKLRLAKDLGADVVINPQEQDVVKEVLRETEDHGADLAIEAAGTEQAINMATALLKHNGTLVLYSYITRPVTLNIGRWHDDAFTIKTTCLVHHTEHHRAVWTPWVLRPIIQGQVKVYPLVTHCFPLEQVEKAMETACFDPKAVKVMLKPAE